MVTCHGLSFRLAYYALLVYGIPVIGTVKELML